MEASHADHTVWTGDSEPCYIGDVKSWGWSGVENVTSGLCSGKFFLAAMWNIEKRKMGSWMEGRKNCITRLLVAGCRGKTQGPGMWVFRDVGEGGIKEQGVVSRPSGLAVLFFHV